MVGFVRRRPSHPARSVPVAVTCLAKLLREPAARALFTRASGVSLLAPLLKGVSGAAPTATASIPLRTSPVEPNENVVHLTNPK